MHARAAAIALTTVLPRPLWAQRRERRQLTLSVLAAQSASHFNSESYLDVLETAAIAVAQNVDILHSSPPPLPKRRVLRLVQRACSSGEPQRAEGGLAD